MQHTETLVIEICPFEGRASLCTYDESHIEDLEDCNSSGDCQPACEFILDQFEPDFRIVAKDSKGNYENRLANDEEIQLTCEEIYFESETDFSDAYTAKAYLVWQAANDLEE